MTNLPTNLKHKPIIEVDNYSAVDAKNDPDADAKYLSLGYAQWNTYGQKDISAKVWRKNEEGRISRQSEELPLHRVLDLVILIAAYYENLKKNPDCLTNDSDVIADEILKEIKGTEYEDSDITEKLHQQFNLDFISNYSDVVGERLSHLKEILDRIYR